MEEDGSQNSDKEYICPPEEMTVGSFEVWNELPSEIKMDPFLDSFKKGYEKHFKAKAKSEARPSVLPKARNRETVPEGDDVSTTNEGQRVDLSDTQALMTDQEQTAAGPSGLQTHFSSLKSPPSQEFKIVVSNYSNMQTSQPLFNYPSSPKAKTDDLGDEERIVFYEDVDDEPGKVKASPYCRYTKLTMLVICWLFLMRISPEWTIPLVSEKLIDDVPEMRKRNLFNLYEFDSKLVSHSMIRLQFKTNLAATFPCAISFDLSPIDPEHGIIYAAFVLLGLYILIVFEIVHRTLAAMLGAAMSVAILALLDERPTKMEMVSWVDVETLLLLFSMMILVAILANSGIFDYLAVLAYKFTNGKVWPLVNTLCFFTALISSILDNVTTVLLMTPVTIRLCEVVELNPVPILMAMIMYSNIGGAITPIGDPPNVIIAMNEDIVNAGVGFGTFVLHMGIALVIVMFCVHIQLRFMFRNLCDLRFPEPQDVQELRHEINVWRRAAESLSSYSKDEEIVRTSIDKKVRMLCVELKKKLVSGSVAIDKYTANLEELQSKYPIRDGWLLLKSGLALSFVITMFFLHSIPELNLSLGWAALLGALLLLILSDKEHIESVFARVEWSTLIFFGALFVLMEALARLGLIDWIGHQTEWVILSVHPDYRLAVALLLILWVSGLASAFVDNIPLTTMMVKIISRLSQKEELELPLQPLVWALALGACLGGNGTLIGASANVVCAGVAEQHGYRFSFMQFLKLGFPVTLMSISITTIYLMIAHVWLGWNGEV